MQKNKRNIIFTPVQNNKKKMTKRLFALIIPLIIVSCKVQRVPSSGNNDRKPYISIERKDYINQYKDLAIREMKRSRIPASITLAQALLESNNGNSTLARKANNHFGIKCHSNWTGAKIYHDDDRRNECFRVYKTVYESYIDHSDFIANGVRYQFLFDLKTTDYKGWAKGLQKAGYATSKTYAHLLVKIIEDNQLYVYDNPEYSVSGITDATIIDTQQVVLGDVDNFKINLNKHVVRERNRIDYIIVKEGDTFESITEEFGMLPFELYKYNEVDKSAKLTVGQVLYLQPKRNKAEVGNDFHEVKEGETMYFISQLYGIKLKKLYEKNLMDEGAEPKTGQKIWLRKFKKHSDLIEETPVIEEFDNN